MKTATLAALTIAIPAAAAAQPVDTRVSIFPIGGDRWNLTVDLLTAPSADGISSIWAEANFDLGSTNGIFSNVEFNRGYVTSSFGPPSVTGDGTDTLSIRNATMPGGSLFAGPDNDNSNPMVVMTFDYTGNSFGIIQAVWNGTTRLVGQNSIAFVDNANPLFGAAEFYQDANGNPGERRLVFPVPAPATAALLGLTGLVATRRRR